MTPLSKAKLALFRSLLEKKYRQAEGMFLVEGIKMFQEAYQSDFQLIAVIVLAEEIKRIEPILPQNPTFSVFSADASAFKQLATLQSPEGIVTVIGFPKNDYLGKTFNDLPPYFLENGHSLLLENIQDPGNVGTILRIADWFGIEKIICTVGTADILNPKTLRASMGAIFRIKVAYISAPNKLKLPPLFAADMQGTALQDMIFPQNACIVLGNEANGVSKDVLQQAQAFTIPKIGGVESLNVGVAAGIIAYHLTTGN